MSTEDRALSEHHIIILVPCSLVGSASAPSGRCLLPATPMAGGAGSPPERIVCDLAVRTQVQDEESETGFRPASINTTHEFKPTHISSNV